MGRTRWWRSRWTWNTSLYTDTSGIHLQTLKCIRTPAESRQEYLTSGKEYIEPCKTQDQALSLWSGSTDSKTLDYQRTNPREYQIVRTHTEETTWIQDSDYPVEDASSEQQTKQKYKPNHQQTGLPPHSALPIRGKANKQKLSTNLTLYETYTNHWTNLRRAETKREKESNLEAWERRPQTQ